MKKKILSLILALSLTISLFSVPASAASKPSIGVSTQLDVDSVSAWKRYFSGKSSFTGDLLQFFSNKFGVDKTASSVCYAVMDEVVNHYGLGERSLASLTTICSAYQSCFLSLVGSKNPIIDVAEGLLSNSTRNSTFWWLMVGKTPEFVIDDDWGTSGIYRIKEKNSGLYVCNSVGQYAYADVGAKVVSSDKSGYQWIGERTASDRSKTGKVQIILESNFQLLQDQLRREGTSNYAGDLGKEYKCIKNSSRQVLANQNGDPIVYRVIKDSYIINEEPREPAKEEESEIITDPSYFIDYNGDWYSVDSLIYDNSTHTYTTNTYTYNYDNRTYEYKTYYIDYHINYTYVYNIGQSEILNEYTQYYKLPDGRSSADLTKEELEQLNLNIDVINYQAVADSSSLRALYHFDGDLDDSSFYANQNSVSWVNTAASITYMDSGAFNGALYLTNNVDYRLSVLLGSSFSPSSDWTVEFRMYCSGVSSDEQDTASGTFTLFGYDALALKGNKFATNASAYSNLPVGVWNHYAFVKSGSTYSVYVNGSRSTTIGGNWVNFSGKELKFFFPATNAYHMIDELRVSDKAVYTENFIPSAVPFDTNVTLVLPDLDDTEVTELSSLNDTFPVDTVEASPAYDSLAALADEVAVMSNDADGEMVLLPSNAIATYSSDSQAWYCFSFSGLPSAGAEITLVADFGDNVLSASLWDPNAGVSKQFTFGSGKSVVNITYTFKNGVVYELGATNTYGEDFYADTITLMPSLTNYSFSPLMEQLDANNSYDPTNFNASPAVSTGTLVVSCLNSGGTASTSFNYTVTLGDTSISGTYGGMTFTNGVATFSLKGGNMKTASNLPAGTTYTVTQANVTDYTTSSTASTGTITKDSTKTATFTNTYVTPTGNLVVSCVNSSGASSDAFTYTVTLGNTSISGTYGGMTFTNGAASFSLTGGNSKTASGLPAGTTYTVTQANKANYTVTSSGTTGTITKNSTKTAAFTNTYSAPSPSTGTLVISVVNDGGSAEQAFDYTITLGDTSVSGLYGDVNFSSGVGNVSILSGSSVTIPGLPVTSYMVSQNENASYTTTSENAAGTIVAGSSVTATFTNTIIQDSEKPSRVVDHPILAVKTQIPVANYQIGGVRPAYPTTGLVWALVEKGYITSIQIYTGYAWEAVDARIWTGSRWIPYNFFNVITLNDMYDVVDASGNQGYEYLYTESGFWNWWQHAWTDFVKLFQNTNFGGNGSSSGSGVTEDKETNISSGEYSSGESVTVVEAVSDSGKGLWSILKGIFGVVGNVFSESGSIGDAFEVTFDDSGGEDSAFYIFDVPLERMSPTG